MTSSTQRASAKSSPASMPMSSTPTKGSTHSATSALRCLAMYESSPKSAILLTATMMMAAITGFSKEEVYGDDLVAEYISDEFRSSVKEVLSNALLGVQTDNYQLPLFTKDGKRVELLLNAATRCDASGAIVGVVGVGQDITAVNQGQVRQRAAQLVGDGT